MASLDRRLNPLYAIKECSSCGNLHTKDCGCSKGSLEDKILVPVPDLSQRPLKIENFCLDCGDPVHGLYCRQWDYTIVTTPLSTEEPVDSLIMEDEHLDTIPATESDEVIKSSVENLVPILSESEGIPDSVCDVPLCNNPTPLEAFKEHSEIVVDFNDDSTSSDDDSPYGEDIDYVDASPPDSELVSLEVHYLNYDDVLREKLSKINLLIAKIEALKDNPPLSFGFVTKSPSTFPNLFLEETNTFKNSSPESETFCFDLERNSSGSTTTHANFSQYDSFIFDISINLFPPADRSDYYHEEFADELAHIISPSEYDHLCFKIEPELGKSTIDVENDIF
ncbi:hypothetical protein Tco_0077553 [Tanacetum coccineum]